MDERSVVRARPWLAFGLATAVLLAGAVWFAFAGKEGIEDPLFFVLVLLDVAGSAALTRVGGTTSFISASFATSVLAVAFLGPAAAALVAFSSQGITWLIERYRWRVLVVNMAVTAVPNLVGGALFRAVGSGDSGSARFYLALALAGSLMLSLNVVGSASLMATMDGYPVGRAIRASAGFVWAHLFNIAFILVSAAAYGRLGYPGAAVLVVILAAFAYMSRLVGLARERTRQYANLSWGVLSGLVRTLDERDSRAARHCAAVARFSRDMAAAVGMSKQEQELAHTAGLLHDIGKFTLSDRVMERGGRLTDADWRGIRRHPEIGAMLLKDLGVYGNVAEIVRAHHERIDGRGYPDRLTGDQIPELAKIVAVAEVYDTLTAPDTYRTPMNSFEALNELRRVAGSQLDERYVEVLAELLSGRGTDYRHADEADFDVELDIERRMNEAAAP